MVVRSEYNYKLIDYSGNIYMSSWFSDPKNSIIYKK